jgi:hypothetical protein
VIELFGVQLDTVGVGLLALGLGASAVGLTSAVASSSAQDTPGSLADGIIRMVSGAAVLVAVALAFLLAVGVPTFAGLFGGANTFVAWAALIAAVGIAGYYGADFSFAFVLTGGALLLLLTEVLPTWLTQPFGFLSQSLFGEQFAGAIDPVAFAVLATAAVVVYYAVQIRMAGNAKNPSTVANRMRTKFERLVREYAGVGRVLVGFTIASVAILLAEGGEVAVEFAGVLADAPLVVSNLFAGVVGYLGFGGGVPGYLAWIPGIGALADFMANLGPVSYLVIVVVVLVVAYGAAQQIEQTAMQLDRERERRREAEDEAEDAQNTLQGTLRRLRN